MTIEKNNVVHEHIDAPATTRLDATEEGFLTRVRMALCILIWGEVIIRGNVRINIPNTQTDKQEV